MRSRYLFPGITFVAVWLPGSVYFAYRMGRKLRLSGPGQASWTPFIDAWTQTAQVWLGIGFFAGVTVFVFERWLEERATRGKLKGAKS